MNTSREELILAIEASLRTMVRTRDRFTMIAKANKDRMAYVLTDPTIIRLDATINHLYSILDQEQKKEILI